MEGQAEGNPLAEPLVEPDALDDDAEVGEAREELAADYTGSPLQICFNAQYVLDFLGLRDRYVEKDLEDAVLREMEAFVLELGALRIAGSAAALNALGVSARDVISILQAIKASGALHAELEVL